MSSKLHGPDSSLTRSHRETAKLIVDAYLTSIGGREALLSSCEDKKAEKKKGKKRGRSSTTTDSAVVNGSKKGRKNGSHPASSTPPASSKEFRPPSGNWEEEVVAIDACEGAEGNIVVYLTWKSGDKSQHPLHQVYKRCPQRVVTLRILANDDKLTGDADAEVLREPPGVQEDR